MMFVVLFHAAIYNFANIHRIDLGNPPLLIVLMSFMALWGGVFIVYSMVVNARMLAVRLEDGGGPQPVRHLAYACLAYLGLHYPLNIFLGRWNVDFINNRPVMTFVASALRQTGQGLPPISELFEGSSLATIGLNLLIVSLLLYKLLSGRRDARRSYWVLGSLGVAVMLFSFVRVSAYGVFMEAQASGNHLLSLAGSFLVANPYPLLPYLGYGLLGALVGLLIHDRRPDLLKRVILPLGLLFVLFGLFGMTRLDKTISKPDFFWQFKTNFELGIFLLMISGTYLLLERRGRFLGALSVPIWFSRVSLTIYMLETTLSEVLRIAATRLVPGWDQTINGCLTFGACNVLVWVAILCLWRRSGFRYSLEYFWVKGFARVGKKSTKLLLVAAKAPPGPVG